MVQVDPRAPVGDPHLDDAGLRGSADPALPAASVPKRVHGRLPDCRFQILGPPGYKMAGVGRLAGQVAQQAHVHVARQRQRSDTRPQGGRKNGWKIPRAVTQDEPPVGHGREYLLEEGPMSRRHLLPLGDQARSLDGMGALEREALQVEALLRGERLWLRE